eukprot:3933986-Rhodomonas_salina.1
MGALEVRTVHWTQTWDDEIHEKSGCVPGYPRVPLQGCQSRLMSGQRCACAQYSTRVPGYSWRSACAQYSRTG